MNTAGPMRPGTLLLVTTAVALTLAVAAYVFVRPGLAGIGGNGGEAGPEAQTQSLEGRPFTVLPGWSSEQIAHGLSQLDLADSREFLAAVKNPVVGLEVLGEPPRDGSLEGYLLPDTYRIFPGMTAEDIVKMMGRNFQRSFVDSLSWKATKRDLDRDILVSVASVVEQEATPFDRHLYASVVLNRLRSSLAVGDREGVGELQPQGDGDGSGTPSRGSEPPLLPPVVNPSLAAMDAVLEAPATQYLYTVRKPDGSHAFAESPEEYARLKDRYGSSDSWVLSLPPIDSVPDGALQNHLEQIVETQSGYAAVAVKDLSTGQTAEVHGTSQFMAEGLWKLPLLVAAFQARDAGKLRFDAILRGGVGTVQDAMEVIATETDDEAELAALALYERLGSRRLQAAITQMGLSDTVLDAAMPRRTTAREMTLLLERLSNGSLLGEASSDELRDLLLLGRGTSVPEAYIPDTIPVASTPGRLSVTAYDVGIFYTEETTYVVAILTRALPDRAPAEEAITCLSKTIYDHLTSGMDTGLPSSPGSVPRPTDSVSSGQAATPRTEAQVVRVGPCDVRAVALTFDTGVKAGYVPEILDILKEHDKRATFAVTGEWAEANPDLLKRIVSEGHALMNHSWSHASFTGKATGTEPLTSEQIRDELERMEEKLHEIAGGSGKPFFRPPYGDFDRLVNQVVQEEGYEYNVLWTMDSMGWEGRQTKSIVAATLADAVNGAIYLYHTDNQRDHAALENIIEGLNERGLEIVTIPQLLGKEPLPNR